MPNLVDQSSLYHANVYSIYIPFLMEPLSLLLFSELPVADLASRPWCGIISFIGAVKVRLNFQLAPQKRP